MLNIRMKNVLYIVTLSVMLRETLPKELKNESDEYCQSEYFRPHCPTNEVILMKNALYGRMSIGKCISEKEIAALGPHFGEDPRYLGCSTDVMTLLDHECSGKPQCEIRIFDISEKNIQPCFPGLIVYLQATYTCISVADEKRSCIVTASKIPTHVTDSASASQRICGTKTQPWIVEAPVGQRIKVTLIDFRVSDRAVGPVMKECYSYGFIADKPDRRNVSICSRGTKREHELHVSAGSRIELFLSLSDQKKNADNGSKFIVKIEAVGCSDIIPPEDTWLKRDDNTIQIGCYSSRHTWKLSCSEGKWVGVLGNCSQDSSVGLGLAGTIEESNSKTSISNDEQVLAIVAISGCTLAICLAIVCIGAVSLRRFYAHAKKKQEYKTINYQINSTRSLPVGRRMFSGVTADVIGCTPDDIRAIEQQAPMHSVYAGDGSFTDVNNSVNSTN